MENTTTFSQKLKLLRKRLTLLAIASALTLSGCVRNQEDHKAKAERKVSDGIETQVPVLDNEPSEEIKDIVLEVEQDDVSSEVDEVVSFYDSIDLSDYVGNSLVDALKFKGYDSSVEFRTELAHYVGFDEYDRSAYQNLTILNYFRRDRASVDEKEKNPEKVSSIDNTNVTLDENKTPSVSEDSSKDLTGSEGSSSSGEQNTSEPTAPNEPSSHKPGNSNKPKPGDSNTEKPDSGKPGDSNTEKPDPEKPEPSKPDPEVPEHQHTFGPWKAVDDESCKRDCVKGDASETQKHKNQVERIIVSNKNGTHQEIIANTCQDCKHYSKVEVQKNCNYDKLISFDDNGELRGCECGHQKTFEHNLATRVNADGSTTTYCQNNGCSYKKTEQKVHDTHSYVIFDHADATHEYWKCNGCDEIQTVGHIFDNGVVDEKGMTVYSCINKGCGYKTEPVHIHNVVKETKFPDVATADYCTITTEYCDICNEIISETKNQHPGYHVIMDGVFDVVYACDTDGCQWGYSEKKNQTKDDATMEQAMSDFIYMTEEEMEEEKGMSRVLVLDENETNE